MNNIEAINHIKEIRETIRVQHICSSIDGECTKEEVIIYRKQFRSLVKAEHALKKQIPAKWLEGYSDDVIKCQRCRREFNVNDNDTQAFNYCPSCGKRLE